MSIPLADLKPYKSILIASVEPPEIGPTPSGPVEPIPLILEAFSAAITGHGSGKGNGSGDGSGNGTVQLLESSDPIELDDGSEVGFLAYSEQRRPAWLLEASEVELQDLEHHLLLICHHRQYVATLLTDKRRKKKLATLIHKLDGLDLVPARKVSNAFLRGPALALWMAGIHPSVTIKPDSKTLHGRNLRDAIDPLGDQTYLVTAARSKVSGLNLTVGSSLHGSRIWIGPSRDWSDCIVTVFGVLDYLDEDPPEDPLPFVTRTVNADHEIDLSRAYELHLLPSELLGDLDELDDQSKAAMERWAYNSQLKIKDWDEESLVIDVRLDRQWLADVRLHFDFSDPEQVEITPSLLREAPGIEEASRQELLAVFSRDRWLRVWFSSGETLVDQQLCVQQYLDLPFTGYQWEDFSEFDVETEKFWQGKFPERPFEAIEASDSLFSWVKSHWPGSNPLAKSLGWLACDDGAMEIADFIHLDTEAEPPVLSLIHVKAAKDSDADRSLSVASYQIVISQAIRNLRYLHSGNIAENFLGSLEKVISRLVWHNGTRASREGMVEALRKMTTGYRRQVVILQPQITRGRLEAVRENKEHRDHAALKQLDTLFLATAESCRQLQAAFTVVASDGPRKSEP